MAGNRQARDQLKKLRRAKNRETYYGKRYDEMGREDDLHRWESAVKDRKQLEGEIFGK